MNKPETIKRIGTVSLTKDHIASDKGRLNEKGKAVYKKLKDYFAKNYGLDIVFKFSPVALKENPGHMIIARNPGKVQSTVFDSKFRIRPRKEGDKNRMVHLTAENGDIKISVDKMPKELADALRDHKSKTIGNANNSNKSNTKGNTKSPVKSNTK